MTRSILVATFLASALFAVPGCMAAAGDDVALEEEAMDSSHGVVANAGISVAATWSEVVTGTPTYGWPATEPVLRVHVEVDDAAIRRDFPGFDGLESAFVRVPMPDGAGVAWEQVDLAWKGTSLRGYYGQIRVDLHDSAPIFDVDVDTLVDWGVAVGLQTNVGTIWAQAPGENHPVTKQ